MVTPLVADSHRLHPCSQRPLHEAAFTTWRRPVCSAQPSAADRPLPVVPHTCPSGPRSFWLVAHSEWVLPGASASGSSLLQLLPRAGWRRQHRPCLEKPWFGPQGCRHGASSVTISSALPLWKNGSIEALKLTSSSESTVKFQQKCLRSLGRDGTQVLGSTHPRLQPHQIHHPPLRLTERRCNPAQLFTEEVPGEEMPSDQQIPTGGCSPTAPTSR